MSVREAKLYAIVCIATLGAVAGCMRKPVAPEKRPRPVTVVKLKTTDPTRALRLTGSTESWKEEKIAFEVCGRVEWVIEEGMEVEGRTYDENGKLLTEGTVLARLDKKRYELRVSSAEAQLNAVQAQAAATGIEIEQVLLHQLKGAEAELKRASNEYERAKSLAKRDAGTQTDLDRAEAEFTTAKASAAEIQASIMAKRAELRSIEAQAQQTEESVKEAKLDLRDCDLVSPFKGRVAQVHIIPGAYVSSDRGVVTVVVMDPLKVVLSVSPATDRMIAYGDVVQVYPPGWDQPVLAWVYTKETAADTATRTFKVTVMVRNRKVSVDLAPGQSWPDLPRIQDLTIPERLDVGKPGPYYMDVNALQQDGQGFYVWQVQNLHARDMKGQFSPVLELRRVRVKPGDDRLSVMGMVFRQLVDAGGLKDFDVIAMGVPDGCKDGDKVLLIRERWLFRPGDLVPVVLKDPGIGPGLYVPMSAIALGATKAAQHHVFVVDRGPNGEQRAKRLKVEVTGAVGEMRRIESPEIKEGTELILDGAHYLIPDELVRVVTTKELGQ